MIFESEKRIYDETSDRFLSAEWVLDTDNQTVTHTDESLNVTTRSFFEDSVAYHLKYRAEENPESLQKLVNEGKILEYLDDFRIKVTDAVNRQTDIWLAENREYQIAVEASDLYAQEAIGNMTRMSAQHEIYNVMVYV
ncbi:MAG: hypothetical protein NC489_29050 [Ruminococcus flavefaciens]|nr:hypothetical protein [Ruminococcus flavefaciens]